MQHTTCTKDSNDHPRHSGSLRISTATLGAEKGWQSCIIPVVYIWLFVSLSSCVPYFWAVPPLLKKKQYIEWELYIIYVHSGIAVRINIYSIV